MPPLNDLLLFTAAAFIMNLSPGPANFYLMARTIAQGTSAGLAAITGLALGGLLHVIAAVLGLSVLFSYSPLAYTLLKIVGASYLVYLGLGHFGIRFFGKDNNKEPRDSEVTEEKLVKLETMKIFVQSANIEASNPKTALFSLALLPPFIVPEAGPATPRIRGNQRFRDKLDKLSGTILISLSTYVLLAQSD
jgi:threonine/homoserine/homoserine lactone efflux protein